jgi:hypothetical protein
MTETEFTDELRKLKFGTELVISFVSVFYKLQANNPDLTFKKWLNHIIETEKKVPDTPDGFVSLDG